MEGGSDEIRQKEQGKTRGSVLSIQWELSQPIRLLGRVPQSICQWDLRRGSQSASNAIELVKVLVGISVLIFVSVSKHLLAMAVQVYQSCRQPGAFVPSRGHLTLSGDIFCTPELCWVSSATVTQWVKPRLLSNILKCTRQSPTTENYLVQNISSVKVHKSLHSST